MTYCSADLRVNIYLSQGIQLGGELGGEKERKALQTQVEICANVSVNLSSTDHVTHSLAHAKEEQG